jgi:hypothetical protein
MSKVSRYALLLGAIIGVIASVMGVLLFWVLISYETFLVQVGIILVIAFLAGLILIGVLIIIAVLFAALFGIPPSYFFSPFQGFFTALEWDVFYPQFSTGLDYSSRALLYGDFFLILLVALGILIAVGFFAKYSEERRSSYIVGGVFGLIGLSLGGVCIYLGLQPLSGYALSLLDYLLVFSATPNWGLIGIGSLLLFLGFVIFGATHLRTREESARPTLGLGIGAMEILTGIAMLGGILGVVSTFLGIACVTILTIGFALMLITFILWIPYAWAEHK